MPASLDNALYFLGDQSLVAAYAATAKVILGAAAVIVPSLYANSVLNGIGAFDRASQWLKGLPAPLHRKVFLLLFGVLPAFESATGFGISLFISIPVFRAMFSPPKAFTLSLLGLNVLPWGSWSLATYVGAALTGSSAQQLGMYTAIHSAFVLPAIAIYSLYVMGGGDLVKSRWIEGVAAGCGLAALLWLYNYLGLTSVSGLLAGCTVLGIYACLGGDWLPVYKFRIPACSVRQISIKGIAESGTVFLWLGLLSYSILCLSISGYFARQNAAFELMQPASASLILLIGIISPILFSFGPTKLQHRSVLGKSFKLIFYLTVFVLAGRLLQSWAANLSGILLQSQGGSSMLAFLMPAIGMASGFIAGSNTGANALAINLQQALGEGHYQSVVAAAIQNSAAGHAVFMSAPIMLLIAVIRQESESGGVVDSPRLSPLTCVKICMKIAVLLYAALVASMLWPGPGLQVVAR